MRVTRFSSTQFRNLQHLPLSLSPGVNLFVGENGQGKTNILEAIHFFKFARSFRAQRDPELIRFDNPFCRVEVTTQTDRGETEVYAVSIDRDGTRKIRIDGKDLPRTSELVGRYPCVLFGPHDLELTTGPPAERRRYLDMVGSMTDPVYLESLRAYRRVVAQRNAALKARDFASAFGVWTEELMARGCTLNAVRGTLVARIQTHLKSQAAALGVPFDLTVEHESELNSSRPDDVDCVVHFAARLAAIESEETRRRTTLVGPHRDDLRIRAGGRDLRRYGSQGQRRLVAVILRLTEMSYIEECLGESCILLLDDLFSELDDAVGGRLREHLDDTRHQIFVTSPVQIRWSGTPPVFRVAAGDVTQG